MSKEKIIAAIIIILCALFLYVAVTYAAAANQVVQRNDPKAGQMRDTDRNLCQYPNRPLDAEGRCDNSDPCDPTTIDGKCKDDPTGDEYDPNWNNQTNEIQPIKECN